MCGNHVLCYSQLTRPIIIICLNIISLLCSIDSGPKKDGETSVAEIWKICWKIHHHSELKKIYTHNSYLIAAAHIYTFTESSHYRSFIWLHLILASTRGFCFVYRITKRQLKLLYWRHTPRQSDEDEAVLLQNENRHCLPHQLILRQ